MKRVRSKETEPLINKLMKYLKTFTLIGLCVLLLAACEDILEVPDISNAQVRLLAPTEGSVLTTNTINLNWEAVGDATGYRVQLATPTFENAAQVLLDSLVEEDSLGRVITRVERALLNGNYQWRVKAQNSGFETPFSSANFTVDGDEDVDLVPPNTPVPVAPTDGSSQDDTEVDFVWTRTDVPGTAERDSIFIFSDAALQVLETKGLGANKTFTVTLSADTYYWFVKAFDAAGNESPNSAVFELTIN